MKWPGRFNILRGSPSRKIGYALAVLATGSALFIKLAIGTLIESPPFLLFFAAVMISSWYGGLGPGLLATFLATMADVYFFFLPSQAFEVKSLDILMVGLFVLEAVIISVLSEVRLSALRQAGELNRLKSQFLSIVSHDLRTPLNAIIGYSSLLRDPRVSENVAKREEMLERIHQNARIQLSLITDVLDLSRIETGKIAIETEQVDLSELIREILNMLEPLGTEKGLVVDFVEDPTAPAIRTDRGKVRQIFTNLIGNAIKFTEQGSIRIRVIHHLSQEAVSVEITDTGIGISEEDLPHIFEPFYQAPAFKEAYGPGTGLGLSIVKRFADLLGGSVEVVSKPGAGSTFTVRFPYDLPA
ncbi:sensor histidine kinase [Candidatus Manganitrophus noduliformans]|nr:ATP-binding protein [Candidatus Manganitrophus noduliformans]